METARVVWLVCVVLWSSAVKGDVAAAAADDGTFAQDDSRAVRGSHRLQLLFPLLLRISTRLATLVPIAMMAVAGIFLFVAFSVKAFAASLLALFLTFLDRRRGDGDEAAEGGEVVYVHKVRDEGEHAEHYAWSRRKGRPWSVRPVRGTSLRSRQRMQKLPADFRRFLSQNVEPGEDVAVRFPR